MARAPLDGSEADLLFFFLVRKKKRPPLRAAFR